jgi:hypothetical protein
MQTASGLITIFAMLTLPACSTAPVAVGASLYCYLDVGSQKPMANPPRNARALRDIARMYPNDPESFGPPPSQQQYSGAQWDRGNEFWYVSDSGDLYLYCNTDDRYVYVWHFKNTPDPVLEDHELLNCSS